MKDKELFEFFETLDDQQAKELISRLQTRLDSRVEKVEFEDQVKQYISNGKYHSFARKFDGKSKEVYYFKGLYVSDVTSEAVVLNYDECFCIRLCQDLEYTTCSKTRRDFHIKDPDNLEKHWEKISVQEFRDVNTYYHSSMIKSGEILK